jgi:Rrf2 family protein
MLRRVPAIITIPIEFIGRTDLRLSKRTEYGLRAVFYLARVWPKHYVQARDLSKQEKMPRKFLEAILLALRRGGFLESKVGIGGGYRLSRAPREISVGDLVRRLEGRLTVKDSVMVSDLSPSELGVRLLNNRLTIATDAVVDALTLEQLLEHVNRAAVSQQAMYYI